MRPVPPPDGNLVPPPAPEAPAAGGMAVAGTVENAEQGTVRVDSAIGYDDDPAYDRGVICRACGAHVYREMFVAHAQDHARTPP